MSNYIVTDSELTSVANAIRTKGGTNGSLVFPGGFTSAITAISGGGGSSDFTTAEVTVVGDMVSSTFAEIASLDNILENPPVDITIMEADTWFVGTYIVPLYKGTAFGALDIIRFGQTIQTSGDIESIGENLYLITGDCTITIS